MQKSTCSTKKEAFRQILVSQTQIDKHLDAIITSHKYIVSNLMEINDNSGTDSDNN